MTCALIIFDCDGTLVASEYLNNKVFTDLLADAGFPQYDMDYAMHAFLGRTISDNVAAIEAETGAKLPADIRDNFVKGVNEGAPELLKTVEGAAATVRQLARRYPVCVASNGERSNVIQSINVARLDDIFPEGLIFTKNMVARGKPAPDLFLYAAGQMGVDPTETIVVEDSEAGVTAAKAAGMTVIGFTGTMHDGPSHAATLQKAGAEWIAPAFADILKLIGA